MKSTRSIHLAAAATLCVLAGLTASWVAWRCFRDPSLPYLPAGPGEWILYPVPYILEAREVKPRWTRFRCAFDLPSEQKEVELSLRSFRRYEIRINDELVVPMSPEGISWKQVQRHRIDRALRSGRNQIEVTVANIIGPPALSLAMRVGLRDIRSDATWETCTQGGTWSPARPARLPMEHSITKTSPSIAEAWAHAQRPLVLWAALAVVLTLLIAFWSRRPHAPPVSSIPQPLSCGDEDLSPTTHKGEWGLLAVATILWIILCANNLRFLAPVVGFDAPAHFDYLRFLEVHRRLPLATDGWEMYQPPLYYVAAVCIVSVCRALGIQGAEAVVPKLLSMISGLAVILGVWMILRSLFPRSPRIRTAGLILALAMPMNIYMAQYPSNEVMSVALVTGGIYLAISIALSERPGFLRWTSLGLVLGLGLLAKHSAFLVVVVVLTILLAHLTISRRPQWQSWLAGLGCTVLALALVAGWFLLRNWMHFRNPLIGNWDPASGHVWWQDPGYGIADYYLRFGRSLTVPFHSSLYSYGDGIYSTVWGDGMCAGIANVQFRAGWNYDLMAVGYLLAIFPSALIVIGLAAALVGWLRRPSATWAILVGHGLLVGFAVLYMTLKLPYYAQAKGFYGLTAIAALCVLGASGFERLSSVLKRWSVLLWLPLLIWAMNSYASYFIYPCNAKAYLDLGEVFAYQGVPDRAIRFLRKAQQLDPSLVAASSRLGVVFNALGRHAEARDAFCEGLRGDPNHLEMLNNLAWLLATCPEREIRNGNEAIRLAERASRLTAGENPSVMDTLAAAQAETGDFAAAIRTIQRAITLAESSGRLDLLDGLRSRLTRYQAGQSLAPPRVPDRK